MEGGADWPRSFVINLPSKFDAKKD